MSIAGFEPGSSGIGSDHSANSATTSSALPPYLFSNFVLVNNGHGRSFVKNWLAAALAVTSAKEWLVKARSNFDQNNTWGRCRSGDQYD